MAKIKSFGVRVFVDGVSVGALTDASVSGVDVTFIDLTTHDSSDGYKEFVSGLLDGGTLDLTGKFDVDDAGQIALQGGAGDIEPFLVIKSDNSGFTFDAVIGGYSTTNPLDDAVEFSASAKITGATTNTILLDPAGANNGILLTGATKSASIVIEEDSTALSVAETDGDAVVTSGDKRRMIVTADFGDGVETIELSYIKSIDLGIGFDNFIWSSDGETWNDGDRITPRYEIDFARKQGATGENEIYLFKARTTSDISLFEKVGLSDVFPHEVDLSDASKSGGATGTPTLTAAPATAAQAIAAINAASIGSTASNAPGSNGSGSISALPTTPQQ